MADIHLGYRAYNRVTSQGLNAREADVFRSFRAAMAKTLQLDPDLVVIAGDLFHTVRPSNLCLQHTFKELMAFRRSCGAPIVIIGGNHETPRSLETGCVLDILTNIPDVHVIHKDYAALRLPDVNIFGLCHRALPALSQLKIEPDPNARHNILAVHGTLEGISRDFYDIHIISPSQVLNDAWDYIALGHYHVYTKLADNAYYSGATEYTSFNIWSETGTPKGIIEYDLDDRKATFHRLVTREVVDLRPIDATSLTAEQLSERIGLMIEGVNGGIQDKIVRLVVENVPRQVQANLDFEMVHRFHLMAMHFELQLRAPRAAASRLGGHGDRRHIPLEEEWREFVQERELPAGVDRQKFIELGLEYLGREESANG